MLKNNRSFCGGGSSLGEKNGWEANLVRTTNECESGFLGLFYPPTKKFIINMLCFPCTLYINYIVYPIICNQ